MIGATPLFRNAAYEPTLERDGLVVVPLLHEDELQALRSFYEELHGADAPPQVRDGIHMTIWCADRAYKERVRDALTRLLTPAVERSFNDLRIVSPVFIVKEPGGSNVFPIHQDWSVVDESRHRALNLWIPLYDESERSGSLWIVPGSHRAGAPIRGAGFLFPSLYQMDADLSRLRVSPSCPAGSALAFYHRLVHGSPANETPRRRIVIGMSLVPRGTPLRIYFQPSADAPLQVYEPPDDFIYEFENVRDDTARVPPVGRPVEIRPPYAPPRVQAADLMGGRGRI